MRLEHRPARWPLGADLPQGEIRLPQEGIRRLGTGDKRTKNPPGNVWTYNCLPIVEAGQALLVDDDYTLDDTFSLTPTPGHAPCHCCVNISSKGQRAVVTGDLMHHALQVREPTWSTIFDWDPQQGIESRQRFLQNVAGTGTFILPIHFPNPTVGLIEPMGNTVRLQIRAVNPGHASGRNPRIRANRSE